VCKPLSPNCGDATAREGGPRLEQYLTVFLLDRESGTKILRGPGSGNRSGNTAPRLSCAWGGGYVGLVSARCSEPSTKGAVSHHYRVAGNDGGKLSCCPLPYGASPEGLISEVVRWLIPRFLVYLAAAVISGLLFIIGAAMYSYVSPATFPPTPPTSPLWPRRRLQFRNRAHRKSRHAHSSARKNVHLYLNRSLTNRPRRTSLPISWHHVTGSSKRSGDEFTLALTFRNPSRQKIYIFASREGGEVYASGSRWSASDATGLTLCDLKSECETPDEKQRHAAVIDTLESLPVKLTFKGYGDAPYVGKVVNVRLVVVAKAGQGRWHEYLIYEPNIQVTDDH
jgi:hypothetical protein